LDRVGFTQMKDGTREDYALLTELETDYARGTASRLLKALVDLDESLSGYRVTRLEHSVQSATRAWHDGADIDWVVATLLHDIGDVFAPHNHDEYAAAILKPFVREQCRWVVETHGDFQLIYYGEHVGANPNKRDKYRGHQFFDDCADFCERWDQSSFDPDYESFQISFFEPMVQEVFGRTPYDPAVLEAAPQPLVNPEVAAQRAK